MRRNHPSHQSLQLSLFETASPAEAIPPQAPPPAGPAPEPAGLATAGEAAVAGKQCAAAGDNQPADAALFAPETTNPSQPETGKKSTPRVSRHRAEAKNAGLKRVEISLPGNVKRALRKWAKKARMPVTGFGCYVLTEVLAKNLMPELAAAARAARPDPEAQEVPN